MIDWNLVINIAVPLATLVLGKYLDRWLTKKPKLISWVGHTSAFTLRGDKSLVVHTHAIVVRNGGRLAAHNVRIGHNIWPENYQINPSVSHTVERHDDGTAEIVIPALVQCIIDFVSSCAMTLECKAQGLCWRRRNAGNSDAARGEEVAGPTMPNAPGLFLDWLAAKPIARS